jgi:putative membrane protein
VLAPALTWVVVVLHVLFGLMETVGWKGMARRFGYTSEQTQATKMLALNQGFYNAGLACVLGWATATGQGATVLALLLYVVAMAVVGAASARWTIFLIQGVPALLALGALLLS